MHVIKRPRATLSLVVEQESPVVSDGELARGLMAGDSAALAETWRRFGPMVLRLARWTLGSAEADDIAQEVFQTVFRKVQSVQESEGLRSLVYGVTIRALQTKLRRKKLGAWLHLEEPPALSELDWRGADVDTRENLLRFRRLLDRLTARERMVFVLRRMESMSVEEIAGIMELSESSVKRAMARASSQLLRWIDADPVLRGVHQGEPRQH